MNIKTIASLTEIRSNLFERCGISLVDADCKPWMLNYSASAPMLRAVCKEMGLPKSGAKAVLVARVFAATR